MTFHSSQDEWLAGLPEPLADQEFAASIQASTSHAEPPSSTSGTGSALALGAAALGATALLSARPARAVSPALKYSDIPGSGDVKVLNYALALEALEADLYRQAGLRLQALNVSSSAIDATYYAKFGLIETGHRDFLNNTLGDKSLLKKAPFKTATFDFGIDNLNRQQVAELVLDAERTGVAAYLGALPSLSSRDYRQVAAAIQGTEARHTTVLFLINNVLFNDQRNVAPVPQNVSSSGNNDIESTGREILKVTTASPGTFQAQPAGGTTDIRNGGGDNVLAKVSPFIVFN